MRYPDESVALTQLKENIPPSRTRMECFIFGHKWLEDYCTVVNNKRWYAEHVCIKCGIAKLFARSKDDPDYPYCFPNYIWQGNVEGLRKMAVDKGYSLFGEDKHLYYDSHDVWDQQQIPF